MPGRARVYIPGRAIALLLGTTELNRSMSAYGLLLTESASQCARLKM